MMKSSRKIIAMEIISALFIILFIYASLSKLKDFLNFQTQLAKSPLLDVLSKELSVVVPVFEIVIAALLCVKKSQYVGLVLSFALMVTFSVYIVAILKFSPYIPCSCGGILEHMSWTQHLIFNMTFIILSAIAILIYPKKAYLQ